MLKVRIIPCLDTRDGRVVKGVRFQGLRDAGDPVERARAYEAQGADELVLLDVSATPEGRGTARDTVRRVRAELSIPLTVGGGVRTVEDAGSLLDAGADKVGVNTQAVEEPELVQRLAARAHETGEILKVDPDKKRENRREYNAQDHRIRRTMPRKFAVVSPQSARNQSTGGDCHSNPERRRKKEDCARVPNSSGQFFFAQHRNENHVDKIDDEYRHDADRSGQGHDSDMSEERAFQKLRAFTHAGSYACFARLAKRRLLLK